MKRKLLLILISAILILLICISFNVIKIYNVKSNIISPNLIHINNVDFVGNKLLFSGYVIGNSSYGDYTEYKYVVKNNKLYIMLYSNDLITNFKGNVEIEIIDDKLYGVTEVYLQQGATLRSIATKCQSDGSVDTR